jgi:hypothetical protein
LFLLLPLLGEREEEQQQKKKKKKKKHAGGTPARRKGKMPSPRRGEAPRFPGRSLDFAAANL